MSRLRVVYTDCRIDPRPSRRTWPGGHHAFWCMGVRAAQGQVLIRQGVIDPYDDVPDGGSSDRGVRHPGVPWGRRSPDWFRQIKTLTKKKKKL